MWEFLGAEARHVDEVTQRLGVSVPEAAAALMAMEMKRLIRRLPGNRYERC